jgi:subtilisin-like proprotein convertase family protein
MLFCDRFFRKMIAMKQAFTLVLFVCCFFITTLSAQQWWTDAPVSGMPELEGTRWIQPAAYRSIDVDLEAVKALLSQAPLWFTDEAAQPLLMSFPMPDGSTRLFEVLEAPVMSPGLAQKYPGMRSFAGKSPEDGTAYARFGYTHKGFHAMISSGRHSTVYIDVMSSGQNRFHQAYYRKDYGGIPGNEFVCGVEEIKDDAVNNAPESLLGDCNLRVYRLALACTGEYALFHGGTVADVMAEYNVAMTRVNGVYERDATVHMELVENTDLLIFLNPATDPYTNTNGGAMLGQNQTTCNNIIGLANYDIGHVFSTGGGGVANLNAVCTNNKARGVTGQSSPVGDPFYIDYVAHEMGHQFGANHTQNNSCNRNNATAMEPGSASTIMGYAGICAPNVQSNSDDHFHAISIQEITNFIENGAGGSCPVLIPLGNTGPFVTTLAADYTLPVSTPFFLTALASDPDDDELTYCWEQMNNQVAPMPPQPTNTGGPAFRSNPPTLSPTRYFPNLNAVVNGATPTWEVLPSVSRNMNFRVSVRDNFMGGGCVSAANVALTFTNQAGPFVVLNPNTALTWTVGVPETITWNPANTDQAPVSCDLVDIYLSIDGGLSYPIQLADDVPNNGSFELLVPEYITTQARVQVVCADNIFYDISDEDFEIVLPPYPNYVAQISPAFINQCIGEDPVYTITLTGIAGYEEPVELSLAGLPAGAASNFDPNPAMPGSSVSLTLSNLQLASPGEYNLEITCVSDTIIRVLNATLNLFAEAPTTVALTEPADGSQGVPLNTTLAWTPTFFASEYFVEISSSPAFGADIVETATVTSPSYQTSQLQQFAIYFWRVTPANICGSAPAEEVFSFMTEGSLCEAFTDNNPGLIIPSNQTGSWSSTLNILKDVEIADVNISINLQHTWIGDVKGVVEGPGGQQVTLFDQPGVPASQYGCGEDNMLVTFDDEAGLTAAQLESTCQTGGPYAIQGVYQPVDMLSVFDGASSLGGWKITLSDIFNQDGGSLVSWSVEICRDPLGSSLVEINNKALLVVNGSAADVLSYFLKYERVGIAPGNITYMLMELPARGQLLSGGAPLSLGATFTQAQINAKEISYQHDGSASDTDGFRFHVYDNEGEWLQNQQFHIQIVDENPLSGTTVANAGILCHGEATGVIEALVNGAAAPLSFSIDGVNFQTNPVFEGLSAGVYEIVAVDALGFQLSLQAIEVTQPDPLALTATLTGNTLEGLASGGTAPYAYSLDGVNFQASGLFDMLENGDYILYVQDANGCLTASPAFTVNLILGAVGEAGEVSCFGGSDGFIAISSVDGGESPYTYSLNGGPGQASPLFENLPAGAYILQITDNQGNTFELSGLVVAEPDELLVNATLMPGAIDIEATGGTPPYQYSLDGGETFSDEFSYSGLASGEYLLVVEDAKGCRSESLAVTVISSVSDIRAAWKLQLTPNPNAGVFALEGVDEASRPLFWQVTDLPGRVLFSGSFRTASGPWSQDFDLPLAAGAYRVRVTDAAGRSAVLALVVAR